MSSDLLLVQHGKSTGAKGHRESKRNEHACTKATEERKLEVRNSKLRFQTEKKTPTGGHQSPQSGGQEKIPAVAGALTRMRAGLSGSRQRLDNRADHRTFTCVTQTICEIIFKIVPRLMETAVIDNLGHLWCRPVSRIQYHASQLWPRSS